MWLTERIKQFGDKPAYIYDGKEYSYKWVAEDIDLQRCRIMEKLKGEDVISVSGDYSPSNINYFMALISLNKVVVPLADSSCQDEKLKLIDRAHPLLKDLISKGHPGLILFSSGSTGHPKIILHDMEALLSRHYSRKARHVRMLVFLLFDHIGGLNTLFGILASGGTAVLSGGRDPHTVCSLIEKHGVQVLPTTPTFLNLLVLSEAYKKFDLSSLTLISYGTESMPETLLKKLNAIFPNAKLLQTYGTSETGISHTHSEANDSLWIKIDGEYRIEDGELLLKSQMAGYLNYDNDSDGWFRTGDLVEDRDGYIRITGRKKDIINIGGQKVFPIEVENALLNMQGIDDALVYGVKNMIMGQAVCAKVVVNRAITRTEIMKHCLSVLDAYKVPTKIELVEKIEFGERFKRRRRE